VKKLPILSIALVAAAVVPAKAQVAISDQTIAFLYSSYRLGEICSQRLGTFTADEVDLAKVAIGKYLDSAGVVEETRTSILRQVDDGMPELMEAVETGAAPKLDTLCTRVSQVLGVFISEQRMAEKLRASPRP